MPPQLQLQLLYGSTTAAITLPLIMSRIHRRTLVTASLFLFLSAFTAVDSGQAQSAPKNRSDFQLSEFPAATGNTIALFWSGDGGWRGLVDDVSKEFSRQGIAVLGVNARAWLTSGTRNIDSLTNNSVELLRYYLEHWKRDRIILIGYSRGAGFSALLADKLPSDLRSRVAGVILLGMEHTASFEFHLIDLVRNVSRPSDIPVKPVIEQILGIPVVCVYGTEESDTVCPELDASKTHVLKLSGSHHFDGNYTQLARDVLPFMRKDPNK